MSSCAVVDGIVADSRLPLLPMRMRLVCPPRPLDNSTVRTTRRTVFKPSATIFWAELIKCVFSYIKYQ